MADHHPGEQQPRDEAHEFEPWQQRPDEEAAEHELFMRFCGLLDDRLDRVADALGEPLNRIAPLYDRHAWAPRRDAYWDHRTQRAADSRVRQLTALSEQMVALAAVAIAKATRATHTLDADMLTPLDISRLSASASRLAESAATLTGIRSVVSTLNPAEEGVTNDEIAARIDQLLERADGDRIADLERLVTGGRPS
ncbi:hypothetical protein [Streptomyces sp. NBRC 109706]|uniref:hypothetical protein n=1 Tax=Streptomyces sp. NBRC 109706 TaxID=1550035 RepID=UPI0007847A52|nr:hypothetical protein [Streptomyces sp. NBRC 109706]